MMNSIRGQGTCDHGRVWTTLKRPLKLLLLLVLALALLTTVVVCMAAAWVMWSGEQFENAGKFDKIQSGMEHASVEALLGGPGSSRQAFSIWLNNRSLTVGSGPDLLNEHRNEPGITYWYDDSGVIILQFDSEGAVANKQFLEIRVSTKRQQIIRWLERIGW
jgi:hypothetical protein